MWCQVMLFTSKQMNGRTKSEAQQHRGIAEHRKTRESTHTLPPALGAPAAVGDPPSRSNKSPMACRGRNTRTDQTNKPIVCDGTIRMCSRACIMSHCHALGITYYKQSLACAEGTSQPSDDLTPDADHNHNKHLSPTPQNPASNPPHIQSTTTKTKQTTPPEML